MEHKSRKKVWIILAAVLGLLAIGFTGILFVREQVRAARQREAEEFKFTNASLSVDKEVTEPGTAVTFTAEASGGKGTLTYESFYLDVGKLPAL